MARTGETCGAVTGALMVIGLKHAKMRPDDDDSRELSYALAQEFMDAFEEHGIQWDRHSCEACSRIIYGRVGRGFCEGVKRGGNHRGDSLARA
jgi:C_GCAxxG_C_C family probable redox protein